MEMVHSSKVVILSPMLSTGRPAAGLTMTTWSRMTTETANKQLSWARHDARPGSRGHRAGAVEEKQRRGRGGRGGPAVLLPGDRGGPLRLDQDLTCSAVLPGVALLLSHRDHEPPCEASEVPDQELVADDQLIP
jgi:hypothetical protein